VSASFFHFSSSLLLLTTTPTTMLSTLSLHDALPIYSSAISVALLRDPGRRPCGLPDWPFLNPPSGLPDCPFRNRPRPSLLSSCRSEEHTSELQSLRHLVCRLLLEKKKPTNI